MKKHLLIVVQSDDMDKLAPLLIDINKIFDAHKVTTNNIKININFYDEESEIEARSIMELIYG